MVKQADEAGVTIRLCGEMGGRPLEALALVGIGLRNFSITPAAVGPVKAMIRSIDTAAITDRMDKYARQAAARPAPVADRLGETAWRCARLSVSDW